MDRQTYFRKWWQENKAAQYARRLQRRRWRRETPLSGADLMRFNERVNRTGTCWIWTGTKTKQGYGIFQGVGAHRLAYLTARGPIAEGYELDHQCRVRPCVNPDHMEPVVSIENVRRAVAARESDRCRHGHLWADNAAINAQGRRICLTCRVDSRRRAQA